MAKTSHANRGMDFEKMLNKKFEEYYNDGIASIFKSPTPWIVQRRYNPKTKKSVIVSAFPKEKALVDYMGDYNGKSIAIEAKKSENKTSFPFKNIKDNQFEIFRNWKGLKYYVIYMKKLERFFLVQADKMQEAKNTLDRKSVTIQWLEENGIEIDKNLEILKYIDNEGVKLT